MSYSLETIDNSDKELKKLANKYPSLKAEVAALGKSLEADPEQGTSIGQSCYKIRLAIKSKGRGKSGGAGVISCVVVLDERVMLPSIYDKADQANIGDAFLLQLLNEADLQ